MSLFNNAIIGASGQGGYRISRSVRLRQSASAYFSRTPASAGNRTTWTWSGWAKLGSGLLLYPLDAGAGTGIGVDVERIQFGTGNGLYWQRAIIQTSTTYQLQSSAVFRDPSAWYHLVLVWDSSNATSTERMRAYVNGVRLTTSAYTAPSQNQNSLVNASTPHKINTNDDTSTSYGDGYLTEVNFIDGQALTPSSFGETNSQTGIWQPKRYAGTYGTNGFYLNFSDNSAATATTMGKDYSGNGNNWTPNNISVTAGVTYDSMLDVPTLYADGGNGRGNYAVLNPVAYGSVTNRTSTSNGNLSFSDATSTNTSVIGTIAPTSGKWYFELTSSNTGVYAVGLFDSITKTGSFYRNNGAYSSSFGGGGTTGYSSWTTGDVIGVAWDADAGKIWYAKNNTWQSGSPSAGTSPTNTFTANTGLTCSIDTDNSAGTKSGDFNFGQRPFTYTPPTGFKALNTQNLPTPTILKGNQYFDATTYTGNGTTTTISSLNFQPDLVWQKNRSSIANHILVDSVRGGSLYLIPNSTGADASAPGYMTFNTNGESFTSSDIATNQNGQTYVAWQWNAGGSTVTNTSGSITSQVRANPTAGFSVVTYTGTGANATVGHGLGVAPKMVIVKQRTGTAQQWAIWHTALLGTEYLGFDTAAKNALANVWNSTIPTSSVFSIGTNGSSGANTINYVAYCFAAVAGYSAFGSYTGNGSTDGPFIYTGFRPRWVMIKRTDSAGFDWNIVDTSRNTYNVTTSRLWADLSNAEDSTDNVCDITSNGFKLRSTNTNTNASGGTYIYMAVAENPFKISLAR